MTVLKGVLENRTMGMENNVADRLKLDVFLECAQCQERLLETVKAKDNDFCTFGDIC